MPASDAATSAGKRLRLDVFVPAVPLAEQVLAELWAAGALGVEERAEEGGVRLIVYLAAGAEPALRRALAGFGADGVRASPSEVVEPVDWSEAWKDGLEAIVVSERLVVRPSFVAHAPVAGQRELIVDPGRAFGTGGHASTRLVLEWLDRFAQEGLLAGARVLDVGTGSGVLAMAAVALGAEAALGFDLDPDAVAEAAGWIEHNALGDRAAVFAGGIEAVAGERFDLVVANLLRREMLPIASAIAAAVGEGGRLVLAGLLDADRARVVEAFAADGLVAGDERSVVDASGDRWIAPVLGRPRTA